MGVEMGKERDFEGRDMESRGEKHSSDSNKDKMKYEKVVESTKKELDKNLNKSK